MGGRDHSVECSACGAWYGGMNGPDECDCALSRANVALRAAVLAGLELAAERSSERARYLAQYDTASSEAVCEVTAAIRALAKEGK